MPSWYIINMCRVYQYISKCVYYIVIYMHTYTYTHSLTYSQTHTYIHTHTSCYIESTFVDLFIVFIVYYKHSVYSLYTGVFGQNSFSMPWIHLCHFIHLCLYLVPGFTLDLVNDRPNVGPVTLAIFAYTYICVCQYLYRYQIQGMPLATCPYWPPLTLASQLT